MSYFLELGLEEDNVEQRKAVGESLEGVVYIEISLKVLTIIDNKVCHKPRHGPEVAAGK